MAKRKATDETTATATETDNSHGVIAKEPEIINEGSAMTRMCNERYRGDDILTNLDLDDVKTKVLLFNAGSAESTPLGEMVGKPFHPVSYCAERAHIKVDDAERMGCRLTLWDKEGTQYFTASSSIVQAFDRLLTLFGDDLAGMGFDVLISLGRTKKGHQWYNVGLVEPADNGDGK